VFLLGVLTRRANERGAIIGLAAGLSLMVYVRFFTGIAWTWYVLIGSAATFVTGYLASLTASEELHDH
jgi:SSS family solute:Na+ symporter